MSKEPTEAEIEQLADEAERGYCVVKDDQDRLCGHPLDAYGDCDVHGFQGPNS